MSILKQYLARQYGPGCYLTNSDLDWSRTIAIEPRSMSDSFSVAAGVADQLIVADKIPYGAGAVSGGIVELPLFNPQQVGFDGAFLFAVFIKKPGERKHHIPAQLEYIAPVIERMASMAFVRSAHAEDKYCALMLRTLPLTQGVLQIAENTWHAHKVLTPDYFDRNNRRAFLEIDDEAVRMTGNFSTGVVQDEYLYSNNTGSLIQTSASALPMAIQEADGTYTTGQVPADFRQVLPHEVIAGSSYVFHAAATPAPEDIGKVRTLLFVGYQSTPSIERILRASGPDFSHK